MSGSSPEGAQKVFREMGKTKSYHQVYYDCLRRFSIYPQFDYINTLEDNPVYLDKNHLYNQAKDSLLSIGGECRSEIVNNYWMQIHFKLGSFYGVVLDKNWRKCASRFFDLMLEANIVKTTLF